MYTTEKYLFDCKNLVSNPSARVPVCLCLDVSGSMDGLPIQELNEGVHQFYQAIKEDETALYAADICVITFGGTEPVCLRDFSGLDQQPEVPTLSAGGMTPMGEAINLGLDLLERRKEQFRSVGVDYFQPWFVLMSDGTEHSLYHKPSRALADILTDVIQRACLIRTDVLQRQLADTFASVVCPRTQDDCSIAILARPGKALRIADQLSVEERRRLYHIQRARTHTARRIRRYDAMLVLLEQPHSLRQIAVKIHLNPRYTKQRLGQLEQLGLIEQANGWYRKV